MIYPNYVKQSPVLGLTSGAAGGASLSYFTHVVAAPPGGGGDDSGAVSFDGDNDYLSITGAGDLAFGTGDFTVECWAYFTGADTNGVDTLIDNRSNNTDGFLFGRFQTSGHENRIEFFTNAGYRVTADVTVSNNTWVHAAAVRHNGTTRVYINGVAQSTTYSDSMNYSNDDVVIGSQAFGSHRFQGLISNFRMVKGTAVYTSNFNPSSTPLTAVTNTKLLCCQSKTSVTDAAVIPAIPGTIVNNGGATVSTSSPFSGGSVYFNSSSLQLTSTPDLCPGNSNFTFECWLRPSSWGSSWETVYQNGVYNGFYVGKDGSGNFVVRASSNTSFITQSTLPPVNQWTHIAVTRQGSTLRLFYDGVLKDSVSNSHNFPTAATAIAQTTGNGEGIDGRISNLRFIKGTALYTSNFTVPTEKLTNVTNTKLLCCQTSGPVTAAAVSPSIITTNNNPQPSTQSPFVAFDGGGSLYLDGSSVVKITSDSAAASIFNIGSSTAFTVEAWVYLTSFGSYNNIMSGWDGSCNYQGILFHVLNSGQIFFGGPGSGATTHTSNASSPVTLNKWHHIAVTRNNGSSGKFYIDGVSAGTFSNSGAMNNHGCGVFIGANMDGNADGSGGSYRPTGYISNLRYVVGHETYTTSFTPPTEPLTTTSQGVPTGACKFLACQDETSFDTNSISVPMTADYGTPVASGKNPFGAVSPGGAETSGSLLLDGTNDYIIVPDNADLDLGNSDFTIEAFIKPTGSQGSGFNNLFTKGWELQGYYKSDGAFTLYSSTSSSSYDIISGQGLSAGSISLNTWQHLAICRSGTTWKIFVDGVQGYSATHSGTIGGNTSGFAIGDFSPNAGQYEFQGYISNFRVIKGTALYTSNFTAPTSALTNVTNTKLLCCQSAVTATDATVTPGTITSNGDPQASSSTPFISASSGSVEFTGDPTEKDYLNVAKSSDFDFSGVFTFEAWAYFDTLGYNSSSTPQYGGVDSNGRSQTKTIAESINWNAEAGQYHFGVSSNNKFQLYVFNYDSGISNRFYVGDTTITTGQWYHFMVNRDSSNNIRLYVNGTRQSVTKWDQQSSQGSSSYWNESTPLSNSNQPNPLRIGATKINGTIYGMDGKISNLRMTAQHLYGSGSTITVPTSKLTTTSQSATASNVKLLCCQDLNSATSATKSPTSITVNNTPTVSSSHPF